MGSNVLHGSASHNMTGGTLLPVIGFMQYALKLGSRPCLHCHLGLHPTGTELRTHHLIGSNTTAVGCYIASTLGRIGIMMMQMKSIAELTPCACTSLKSRFV